MWNSQTVLYAHNVEFMVDYSGFIKIPVLCVYVHILCQFINSITNPLALHTTISFQEVHSELRSKDPEDSNKNPRFDICWHEWFTVSRFASAIMCLSVCTFPIVCMSWKLSPLPGNGDATSAGECSNKRETIRVFRCVYNVHNRSQIVSHCAILLAHSVHPFILVAVWRSHCAYVVQITDHYLKTNYMSIRDGQKRLIMLPWYAGCVASKLNSMSDEHSIEIEFQCSEFRNEFFLSMIFETLIFIRPNNYETICIIQSSDLPYTYELNSCYHHSINIQRCQSCWHHAP